MSTGCPDCLKPVQADCCPHSFFCEDHLDYCPQCRAALREDWDLNMAEDFR